MSTTTSNLNLVKPATTDAADISVINGNMDTIDAAWGALMGRIYPVGAIYVSTAATSPATLFGVGTWERIQDCFLLAAGSSYTAGDAGGAATHTITAQEMPAHSHSGIFWGDNQVASREVTNDSGTTYRQLASSGNSGGISTNHYVTGSAGGGQAMDIMPPYLAVYVWKRTA